MRTTVQNFAHLVLPISAIPVKEPAKSKSQQIVELEEKVGEDLVHAVNGLMFDALPHNKRPEITRNKGRKVYTRSNFLKLEKHSGSNLQSRLSSNFDLSKANERTKVFTYNDIKLLLLQLVEEETSPPPPFVQHYNIHAEHSRELQGELYKKLDDWDNDELNKSESVLNRFFNSRKSRAKPRNLKALSTMTGLPPAQFLYKPLKLTPITGDDRFFTYDELMFMLLDAVDTYDKTPPYLFAERKLPDSTIERGLGREPCNHGMQMWRWKINKLCVNEDLGVAASDLTDKQIELIIHKLDSYLARRPHRFDYDVYETVQDSDIELIRLNLMFRSPGESHTKESLRKAMQAINVGGSCAPAF